MNDADVLQRLSELGIELPAVELLVPGIAGNVVGRLLERENLDPGHLPVVVRGVVVEEDQPARTVGW